jgi:clathrin heavy chain
LVSTTLILTYLDSYIRANDPSNYVEVIEIASRAGKYEDLIRYLQMARKSVREPQVDGYLLLSFAKTDRLHDLEDFLSSLNVADVPYLLIWLTVGTRCWRKMLQ